MNLNRLESLFNVVYGLLYEKGVRAKRVKWQELDASFKAMLENVMNGGIPKDKAKYTVCELSGIGMCLVEFYDGEKKFTAHYLLYGDEVIYTNEY